MPAFCKWRRRRPSPLIVKRETREYTVVSHYVIQFYNTTIRTKPKRTRTWSNNLPPSTGRSDLECCDWLGGPQAVI